MCTFCTSFVTTNELEIGGERSIGCILDTPIDHSRVPLLPTAAAAGGGGVAVLSLPHKKRCSNSPDLFRRSYRSSTLTTVTTVCLVTLGGCADLGKNAATACNDRCFSQALDF